MFIIALTMVALHAAAFAGVRALSRHSALLIDDNGEFIEQGSGWQEHLVHAAVESQTLEV
jgi:hypothetical protein